MINGFNSSVISSPLLLFAIAVQVYRSDKSALNLIFRNYGECVSLYSQELFYHIKK